MSKLTDKILSWANLAKKAPEKTAALSYLVDAANFRDRFRRPFEPLTVNTIGIEINQYDWLMLLSDSRKLYCNLGPVTGAIDDKATYSIGRAWNAKYLGTDPKGLVAEKWVNEMWYPMADARGPMFDFKTDLFLQSVSVDRDGEIYIYLTENQDGWPQIQLLPAHLIGNRNQSDGVLSDGPYQGMTMRQGVITNDQGQAVAFKVLGLMENDDEFVSAQNLIQVFDPRWADQIRGFPAFMHALLDLKDLRQIQGYEKIAAELMSSVGLIEWNETGSADLTPEAILKGTTLVGSNPVPQVTIEQIAGGGNVKYFRAASQSKIEQLKNDRPSVQLDAFMDRLIRNACVGAGWPFELTWDASKLGGANVRLLLAKAMRSVEDRQDLLRPVARRCVGYAVAKAIKSGLLEGFDDWYAWRFTMPARMTADYGREAAADLADYEAGLTTMTDILGEQGIDLDTHIATRQMENEKLKAAGLSVPISPQQERMQATKDAQQNTATSTEQMAALNRRHTETIAALATQPAPQVHVGAPQITVQPPQITLNQAPVTVHQPTITLGQPTVNVSAPVVNMPEQKPSIVNLTVPAQTINVAAPTVTLEAAAPIVVPAPVVNIENEVIVPPLNATLSIQRDARGFIKSGQITDTEPTATD